MNQTGEFVHQRPPLKEKDGRSGLDPIDLAKRLIVHRVQRIKFHPVTVRTCNVFQKGSTEESHDVPFSGDVDYGIHLSQYDLILEVATVDFFEEV